jgi:diguanylate cyclase (GGDEF)-like protein/PAS domain S-box-containing protein
LRAQNEMILNSVGEGLVGMDQEGLITFINPAGSQLLGYQPEEILGKNLHNLIHHKKPDGTPYLREECPMYATITTGEISQIADEVFWTKTGEPLPVEYMTTALKKDGQVVGAVGVFRDITEHVAMERLRVQNEMILNSIGEGLFEIDRNGEIIFVNPAAVSLTGFEVQEMVGQSLHQLLHSKKADGSPYPVEECPIYATLRDGESRRIPDDILWTKNGQTLPVAYLTNPVREDDKIVGVVGSFRDITWRKQAEAELKQSNEYLEKVFDGSAEGIGIVDTKGLVKKWNKASEEIYGYTFKELEGQPASELYADKDALAKMLIQLRREDYLRGYEIEMKRKDGNIFPASLSIRILRDETGNSMGSVTVARDLTDVKEKEAKLRNANEQLQALVAEANQRNRNMTLLQEMSDVFQSCQTSGETYSAIAHFVPKFFPDYGGGLYILNNAKDLFEMTAIWGDASTMELGFGQDECWSLRRSRAYLVADSKETMNCRHVSSPLPGSYLCVPMMAQGEVMGIFHLRKPETEPAEQIKGIGQFATTVAEAMAMALANLKLRETLRNQAIRDGLTGLFNRRYMEETLDRELSRGKRQGNPMGVIMMDLDHFKEYNDTYGHNAGDELLCALGQLIQEGVRREDIACRYGGEEFLLIMPGASLEVTLSRANDLCQAVKQLHKSSAVLKPITISAGVAIFPEHGASGKDVIRAADAALYRAKEEGRDRVVVAENGQGGKLVMN